MSRSEATEAVRRSPRWRLLLLLGGAVICLLLAVQLRSMPAVLRFFVLMERIPEWGTEWRWEGETPALCRAEQAAALLLGRSERDRRLMVSTYGRYLLARRRLVDNYNYVMRRYFGSFHQLPDDYPAKAFRIFVVIRIALDVPESHLWPLGHEDGRLVVASFAHLWRGSYYDGRADYDVRAAEFGLRSLEELGCLEVDEPQR